MSETLIADLKDLRRDLALRGYNESEVDHLLQSPILLIPGPLTLPNSSEPIQKLTNHIVYQARRNTW